MSPLRKLLATSTPGPWLIGDRDDWYIDATEIAATRDGDGRAPAHALAFAFDEADARLVALAPVLADLLDRAMAELEIREDWGHDVVKAAERVRVLRADFEAVCATLTENET